MARRFSASALGTATEVAETTEEHRKAYRAKIKEKGWKEIAVVDGQVIFEVADDYTPPDREIQQAFLPDGAAIKVPSDYPRQ